MAPATRVASHRHQSGGCSLCTFSLHASWHSSSKTTIPGLSRAAGQHTHPHILSSPPVLLYAHSIHKSTTFLLNFYFTASVTLHQPAFHPAPGFILYAQPPPVQIPVATPTRTCPPNPTPPSTLTPAQPAWADLSEELALAKQVDELPTLLLKPNKGKGEGQEQIRQEAQSQCKGKHHNGFNNSWIYDRYGYDWYWH